MTNEQAQLLLRTMQEVAEAVKDDNDGEYGGPTVWSVTNNSAAESLAKQFNELEVPQ